MDINTATWLAGLSGGALGAGGAFMTALGQRAWDRRAAERLRLEEDRAARSARVHEAVARLFAAVTDLQLTLRVVTADHFLGIYGRHAVHAVHWLPDVMSRVMQAATEIELAADDDKVITATHAVLERLMDVESSLRSQRYRRHDDNAIEALNRAAVDLRGITRSAAGLPDYQPPDQEHPASD